MRKIIALVLCTVLSLGICSIAMAEESPTKSPEEKAIGTVRGVVAEVRPFFDADGNAVSGKTYILIRDGEDRLTNFLVITERCKVSGKAIGKVAVGDGATATFDATLPMTMIYPPQHTALSIEFR